MIFKKSYAISSIFGIPFLFFLVAPAFAHVIIYPKQVGIAQTQVFDVAVPTEKDTPTIGLKLLIPSGMQEVVPNVKQGWTIHVVKKGDTVVEIDWTNGVIPPEQRDDFYFQAQVPPTPTILQWKAYQTYQDGSVVAWDHAPTVHPEDDSAPPPYSTTKVINDLKNPTPLSSQVPFIFSIVALLLSAFAVGKIIRVS